MNLGISHPLLTRNGIIFCRAATSVRAASHIRTNNKRIIDDDALHIDPNILRQYTHSEWNLPSILEETSNQP